MATRTYSLKFSDGKRCTAIVMDGEASEEKVQSDMREQFKRGYLQEIVSVKAKTKQEPSLEPGSVRGPVDT
jgi:hypothetical protein